jgi:hypothetical protein
MVICKIDGCNNKKDARGMCKLHYNRWKRHGDALAGRAKEGDPLKFIEFALTFKENDCLEWPYAKVRGYANIGIKYVSRIICEKIHGTLPFSNAEALHKCGNGNMGCVNPTHICWGSHEENMRDMVLHGKSNLGKKFGSPSEETRLKRSSSIRGHICSPETRAKISAKAKERFQNASAAS